MGNIDVLLDKKVAELNDEIVRLIDEISRVEGLWLDAAIERDEARRLARRYKRKYEYAKMRFHEITYGDYLSSRQE